MHHPQSNERSLRSENQRPVPKFDEDPFQVNLKPTFTRELEPDIRQLIERMDEQNISLLIINNLILSFGGSDRMRSALNHFLEYGKA